MPIFFSLVMEPPFARARSPLPYPTVKEVLLTLSSSARLLDFKLFGGHISEPRMLSVERFAEGPVFIGPVHGWNVFILILDGRDVVLVYGIAGVCSIPHHSKVREDAVDVFQLSKRPT
jgi:hypothetical protein